jgi:hypothetical protein
MLRRTTADATRWMEAMHRATGLASVTRTVLYLFAFGTLASGYSEVESIITGGDNGEYLTPLEEALIFGYFAFAAVTAGVFGVWLHAATSNLRFLNPRPVRFLPGLTVVMTLLPCIMLLTSLPALDQTVTMSRRGNQPRMFEPYPWSRSALVNAWWLMLIGTFGLFSLSLYAYALDENLLSSVASLAGVLLISIGSILAARIVGEVERSQRERLEDLLDAESR